MTVAEPTARHQATTLGTRVGDAADDPVLSGPMPVLELQDGRLRVHVDRDVTVVALDGGVDDAFVEGVAPSLDGVLAGARAIVLDVDQVTLLDEDAFRRLASAFEGAAGGAPCCIVASRLSGRMVLERWGLTSQHAVFGSVPDALQARAFEGDGYGDGWTPTG